MLARARAFPGGRALLLITAVVVVLAVSVVSLAVFGHPSPSPTPIPTASPSSTPSPSPSPTPSPTPTPQPTPNPFASRRVTVLILGSDSTPSRLAAGSGRLTDSIIVLSVNAAHTRVSMISLPRDMVDIPLGNGELWRTKINSISYYRGEATMKAAVAATLRQPIDYYIEINMVDFGALVNAIGGVDIQVPKTIIDPSIGLKIYAGKRHLDGNLALSYARSRHTTNDWDRAARQQVLLAAIIRKMVDPATQIDFVKLIASLQSMRTDLALNQFLGLIEVARLAANVTYTSKVLAPPQFSVFSGIQASRGYIEEPNLPAIRAYAASVMGS